MSLQGKWIIPNQFCRPFSYSELNYRPYLIFRQQHKNFSFQKFKFFFSNSFNNYPPATENSFTRNKNYPKLALRSFWLKLYRFRISVWRIFIICQTTMTFSEPASSIRAGTTSGYILLILAWKLLEKGNKFPNIFLFFFA